MPQWLNLEILCDVLSTILFTIDKKYINDFSFFYNEKVLFRNNNNTEENEFRFSFVVIEQHKDNNKI